MGNRILNSCQQPRSYKSNNRQVLSVKHCQVFSKAQGHLHLSPQIQIATLKRKASNSTSAMYFHPSLKAAVLRIVPRTKLKAIRKKRKNLSCQTLMINKASYHKVHQCPKKR